MHHITFHVWLAAIGGFLFILVGVARKMERSHLIKMNRRPESQWVWLLLVGIGICLLIFAFGIMTYHMNHE